MILRKLIILVIAIPVLCSCVRRRMTVRSNPPGALVYIDDQEIGKTPVSTSYTYYGTRKIRLVRDGYETQTVMQKVSPPWYQYPPLDFFSENIYPGELRDERVFDFEMVPQEMVPREELLGRADDLRSATLAGYAVPTPNVPESTVPRNRDEPVPGDRLPPPFFP